MHSQFTLETNFSIDKIWSLWNVLSLQIMNDLPCDVSLCGSILYILCSLQEGAAGKSNRIAYIILLLFLKCFKLLESGASILLLFYYDFFMTYKLDFVIDTNLYLHSIWWYWAHSNVAIKVISVPYYSPQGKPRDTVLHFSLN